MVQCQSPGGQSCCWKAVTYPCWDAGLKMDSAQECSFTPIVLFLEESVPQCLIIHKISQGILFTSKLYLIHMVNIHVLYAGGIITRTEVGIWCPSPLTFPPLNNKRKNLRKDKCWVRPQKAVKLSRSTSCPGTSYTPSSWTQTMSFSKTCFFFLFFNFWHRKSRYVHAAFFVQFLKKIQVVFGGWWGNHA